MAKAQIQLQLQKTSQKDANSNGEEADRKHREMENWIGQKLRMSHNHIC